MGRFIQFFAHGRIAVGCNSVLDENFKSSALLAFVMSILEILVCEKYLNLFLH